MTATRTTAPNPPSGPLAGIRVLDLSAVILGPVATQILGDLGADVIKVERPEGDSSRYVNPGRSRGMSGTAMTLHRNKRSVILDLREPAGRETLLRLAGTADALIHNTRPQAMARLGLDYDSVHAVHPGIVYCACTGFGTGGAHAGRPAYDDLIQGASGLADLAGRKSGQPSYVPSTFCDKIVGITAVYALLAALLHRQRTGEGQYVEVPMLETMVAFNLAEHIGDGAFQPPLEPVGYKRVLSPDRRPYATLDGHVCLLPYTDAHWRAFFRMVNREELAEDPRFATLPQRTGNTDALYAIVAEEAAKKTTDEWLRLFGEAEIPASPVVTLDGLQQHPHLESVGFFESRDHPSEGAYLSMRFPVAYSATPCTVRRDAPRLGEHAAEVLAECGFTEEEIEELRQSGALGKEAS